MFSEWDTSQIDAVLSTLPCNVNVFHLPHCPAITFNKAKACQDTPSRQAIQLKGEQAQKLAT